MNFAEYIGSAGFRCECGAQVLVGESADAPIVLCGGSKRVDVADGVSVRLIAARAAGSDMTVSVNLGAGARVEMVEWYDGGRGAVHLKQQAGSRFALTSVVTGSATADYATELNGAGAEYILGGVFFADAGATAGVRVRVAHNAADCRSESTVKGVAAGDGRGRFEGLVYVAEGAQRTDARQTSRNLLIGGEARITTLPQLEIYADDVKCSHGATVGQMDADAILYMRQRGISEPMARRLQVGGFIADVVMHCAVAEVGEALLEALQEKTDLL